MVDSVPILTPDYLRGRAEIDALKRRHKWELRRIEIEAEGRRQYIEGLAPSLQTTAEALAPCRPRTIPAAAFRGVDRPLAVHACVSRSEPAPAAYAPPRTDWPLYLRVLRWFLGSEERHRAAVERIAALEKELRP